MWLQIPRVYARSMVIYYIHTAGCGQCVSIVRSSGSSSNWGAVKRRGGGGMTAPAQPTGFSSKGFTIRLVAGLWYFAAT
jgi:hypothetical protein